MLEKHLNDVNLPLDILIEKRKKNEDLYDDLNYPALFNFATQSTNTGEEINDLKQRAIKIFDVLLREKEERKA